jgi:RecA/RadA recombinase
MSGRPSGGIPKGAFVLFVGKSSGGKTWVGINALGEACISRHFADYDIIYDATTEDGALMDIGHYFGSALEERIQIVRSGYIEEFYYNVDDAHKSGRPFVYMLDSMAGLLSEEGDKKFDEQKEAHAKGKTPKGDYVDGVPKKNSRNIRRVCRQLRQTGSILIVVNQTRDNPAAGMFEPSETYSGGRALKFFSQIEVWTKPIETLKKTVRGRPRQIGHMVQAEVKKNRITGHLGRIAFPIYHDLGVDDVESCIDHLILEKHWRKQGDAKRATPATVVTAPELDFKGRKEDLIRHIEENDLEITVRKLVGKVWREVADACRLKRKPRYA